MDLQALRAPARNKRDAATRAEQLAKALDLAIPVDIEEVAKRLGLKLLREKTTRNVSGALVTDESICIVFVNGGHPQPRQRFSIAHEIGHYLLHAPKGKKARWRDDLTSKGTNPEEIQANTFAAALLMPSEAIKVRVRTQLSPMDDQRIRSLAREFGVSSEAMAYRLQNLNLLA